MQSSDSFTGYMKSLNINIKEYDKDTLCGMTFSQLSNAKTSLESSLEALFDLLQNQYNFDMTLSLVIDGFPRGDIDVVSIRLLRSKIVRLRNDLRLTLDLLESHLHSQLSSQDPKNPQNPQSEDPDIQKLSLNNNLAKPFALVTSVAEDGPAHTAGLTVGDRIVLFDTINCSNHANLSAIPSRLSEMKNSTITVQVLRNGQSFSLSLIPTDQWSGNGLLGCHVIPIN